MVEFNVVILVVQFKIRILTLDIFTIREVLQGAAIKGLILNIIETWWLAEKAEPRRQGDQVKVVTNQGKITLVGCWSEKAQQRVELWLGESNGRQQGVKGLI